MKTADEIYNRGTPLSLTVRTFTYGEFKEAQLDAWKRGMSDAANLCTKREPHGGVSDEDNIRNFGELSSFLRLKILTARNNKTSL